MKMKWIQKLRQIDIGISVIALVLLIAVTFAGVIFRYVFSKPFSWQEEVQLALIIWVIFFGARYAFETFSHVAIDMLYELFPAKAQKVLTVLIAVVVTVVLGNIYRLCFIIIFIPVFCIGLMDGFICRFRSAVSV